MIASLAVGTIWLALAGLKAAVPGPFFRYVEARGCSQALAHAVGWGLIVGEFLIGGLLILGGPRWRARAAWTSLGLAAAMTAHLLLLEPTHAPPCGCFGGALEASMGQRLIVLGAIGYLSALALDAQRPSAISAQKR